MKGSNRQNKPLTTEQLYHACNPELLDFETTGELEQLSATIGQERALEAIDFGVGMPHEGYNLYVMGSTGLGRHTLVKEALKKQSAQASTPTDWCYIANFQHPHSPCVLVVPAGTGRRLRRDMEQLIDDLLNAIPAAFQGDEYRRRAKEIRDDFKEREDRAATELGGKAAERGIALLRGSTGFTLTPQQEGKILSTEDFHKLPKEEQQRLGAAMEEMKEDLKETMSRLPEWQREMRKRFKALDQETVELTVSEFIGELEKEYHQFEHILTYLSQVKLDIIEKVDQFRQSGESDERTASSRDPEFNRYQVNILVDNADTEGAPVIFEDNPTYQNLVGRIEHIAHLGTLHTDFTLIKAGALQRANGGFLVLDAEKVLANPFAWDGLKRSLKAREVRIESLERQLSLVSTISLEPQPIPIDLKVVLIGSRMLFYLRKAYEPEFSLLFKVTADFTEQFPRAGENELLYARLIATLQQREGLRDITREAVARIIEQEVRRSQDGAKISLNLGGLIDLLQEADSRAGKSESQLIQEEHIQQSVDAQTHRVNQLQEQLQEEVLKGKIRIETEGTQLAQVNALSVVQLGDYAFGAPTRISATARIGGGELIDIERETEQGGPIHSKGVLILTSYLGQRYAKHQPLSVSASLVFEQTYGLIEGDSASAAELCALLSALGDIPLKQSLAITGSINQHGQIQAIGGVCQKIEGFFEICKARGLTGRQGVIIPAVNVDDLMLQREVVEAAQAGRFHVYAVDHVEQAMELLTGLPAGAPDANGIYPEGSINHLIQFRLAEWIALRQHFAGSRPDETQ
jgi:predicted ATP-dependent protease